MPKMSAERLKHHHEMKRRALDTLESLKGEDIQIGALRDRLCITTDEGRRILALALESLRDDDHKAARGRRIGWWKWAQPVQQPLPVARAVPETGLKSATVDALRERIAHARAKHPNTGFAFANWLAALLHETAETADADTDERTRNELLDVATVALRAFEEWGR